MSKRFILDTNIILYIALERNTFYEAAKEVLFTIEYNQFEACI